MSIGFNCSEAGHIVNLIPPVDGNNGNPVTCTGFSMAKWDHASIILQLGVTAAAPTSLIVYASTAATGGTTVALPFRLYTQTVAGATNDVMSGPFNMAATGLISSSTPAMSANDNIFYTIEMDSAELPDGKPYVQVALINPASGCLNSAVAILSAGRYQVQDGATVTA